ncbi:nucleotide-binding universal stress UspA family protein [Nitrosomonas nitrosa]|uniref:universal stress protein n=1 Tax=Nitrosomonas nitrosa TaxID=52442 RepID=UPI000D3072D2|nr:universal stress protein [Nitrosomonas nitrosa]PTQ92846.1 nucleotide-binding universal stress UspA family protein [Nitrosomonas nitrosa]
MIKRVLIPLDGSELAERAVPHLLRFITSEQTELLLMTALSSSVFPLLSDKMRSLTSERIVLSDESEASEQMQMIAQQLVQRGFRVESQFLPGVAAECILHLSEKANVDLIAMSTHGRTGIELALLGSVADKVVRNARSPVFIVPSKQCAAQETLVVNARSPVFIVPSKVMTETAPPPRAIVLPLDGTTLAETALPVARQFAKDTGAVIHLLRVIEFRDSEDELVADETAIDLNEAKGQPVVRQAACYLERIQLQLQLAGVVSRCHTVEGDPAEAIIRMARAEDADLITMSTHGRSGVERIVHGSVVSQVISNAMCPLLLMRGKVPVEAFECEGSAATANSFC